MRGVGVEVKSGVWSRRVGVLLCVVYKQLTRQKPDGEGATENRGSNDRQTDRQTDGWGDMASAAEVEKQQQHNVDALRLTQEFGMSKMRRPNRLGWFFSLAIGRDQIKMLHFNVSSATEQSERMTRRALKAQLKIKIMN